MRFSRIEIHAAGRLRVTLNLSELRHQSPYVIKAMSGLDVTEMTSRFYGFSNDVGEDGLKIPYFEPVLPPRDIAVRVGYRPNYENYGSRSDLRNDLYRLLGVTRTNKLELRFYNEADAVMTIQGTLTKLEPSLFTEESEVILTFNCEDPIFRGLSDVVVETPPSEIQSNERLFTLYDGMSTHQHGLSFQLTFTQEVDMVIIDTEQHDNVSRLTIDISSGYVGQFGTIVTFEIGDILTVDTRDKLPKLVVTYADGDANLIDKVAVSSVWPKLHYGENVIGVTNKLGASTLGPPTVGNAIWRPHYAGV